MIEIQREIEKVLALFPRPELNNPKLVTAFHTAIDMRLGSGRPTGKVECLFYDIFTGYSQDEYKAIYNDLVSTFHNAIAAVRAAEPKENLFTMRQK